MDKPIKQYMQHLTIDTVNGVAHLDTAIYIALSHKKLSKIKQKTFYTKDY
jgi:hypothetical protein